MELKFKIQFIYSNWHMINVLNANIIL